MKATGRDSSKFPDILGSRNVCKFMRMAGTFQEPDIRILSKTTVDKT